MSILASKKSKRHRTSDSQERIAVIGGGLAGLASAWLLGRRGFGRCTTIFEERDHFGGRIERDEVLKSDHGAHYFLASEKPLSKLVQELRIGKTPNESRVRNSFKMKGSKALRAWPVELPAKLKRHEPKTAKALLRLLEAVSCAQFVSGHAETWLNEYLEGNNAARRWIEMLVAGELCGPISHASAHLMKGCLDSIVSEEEEWFSLRGGMSTLVNRLVKDIRSLGGKLITKREVSSVTVSGEQLAVSGVDRFDVVIVACPLRGKMQVMNGAPDVCYHKYTSVLFRSGSPDLRKAVPVSGLYTDGIVNFIERDARDVYRILIPEQERNQITDGDDLLSRCEEELNSLSNGRHMRLMKGPSVRDWETGLPCSCSRNSDLREKLMSNDFRGRGIFFAGDWLAEYPSMDGAVCTACEAAGRAARFLGRGGDLIE